MSAAAVTAMTMTATMAAVHVMQRAAEAAKGRPAVRPAIDTGNGFETGPAGALVLHKSHRDRTDRSSPHQGEHDSSRTFHIASSRDST
jgi:hypothetical protein